MASNVSADRANLALVWGNCQAAPLSDLLRAPLAAHGIEVVTVPAVYLATAADVARVHELLRRCAVLVTQPVREEYEQPGCGTEMLVLLLPAHARVVRLPIVYDVGAFPFQVRGYAGDGHRIDAPLTDYHDLRIVEAAERGWSVQQTVASWPTVSPGSLHAIAQGSLAELRRREAGQDVIASDLVSLPDALWTMTHPSNALLAELATRVLAHLGLPDDVLAPQREYLGQRRAAVDDATAALLGWDPSRARPDWVVDGRRVPLAELVESHLAFYARRPDVVAATVARNAARATMLAGTVSDI